ncbi:MAG: OmpA family protein [Woeseiaceae bacterium]
MRHTNHVTTRAWTAALILLISSHVHAAENDTIFTEPPSPETLAKLLYGPKYRTALAPDTSAPGRFGMMVNFEYDSIKIIPKSLPLLDSVGQMLQSGDVDRETLVIEGHADASGPAVYNQRLSERRAEAIKRYLVGTFDLAENQLVTVGAGEGDLHNTRDPYHEINRRVVFRTARSIVID